MHAGYYYYIKNVPRHHCMQSEWWLLIRMGSSQDVLASYWSYYVWTIQDDLDLERNGGVSGKAG